MAITHKCCPQVIELDCECNSIKFEPMILQVVKITTKVRPQVLQLRLHENANPRCNLQLSTPQPNGAKLSTFNVLWLYVSLCSKSHCPKNQTLSLHRKIMEESVLIGHN